MTIEPKKPSAKKIRTRLHILDRAGELFATQGVNGTTMEQIGEAAGLTVGALYTHFSGKGELALAFVGDGLDVVERYLNEARALPSPLDRVCAAGDAYFRFAVEKPIACRFAAIRVLQPDPGPEYAKLNQAFSDRVHRLIIGIAEDAKEAMRIGELAEMPVDEVMVFLWGAWNGVTSLMLRQDGLAIAPEAAYRALQLGRVSMKMASAQAAILGTGISSGMADSLSFQCAPPRAA